MSTSTSSHGAAGASRRARPSPLDPAQAQQPGTRLGRYRIEGLLGKGGMGFVHRAFDASTQRRVALKVAKHTGAELVDPFLQEGAAQSSIRHPHVMPVYDRGWVPLGPPYFVMELLYEPIELAAIIDLVQRGALGGAYPRLRRWRDLRALVRDVVVPVARGVDAANREFGLLHRDLKPSNVLVDVRTRRPYVIDFGNCRAIDDTSEEPDVVGTARYLSPEQARRRTHPTTDVWGLGAILRHVVCGEPPIRPASRYRRSAIEARRTRLDGDERRARRRGDRAALERLAAEREALASVRPVEDLYRDARDGRYVPLPASTPAGLRAIVDKAMAADPEARYPSAGALADDLAAWVEGRPVRALAEGSRPRLHAAARRLAGLRRRAALVLGALVLGAFVGYLFGSRGGAPDFRAADARAAFQRIPAALDELGRAQGDGALPVRVVAFRHRQLVHEHAAWEDRLEALRGTAAHAGLARAWHQLAERLAPRPLDVEGPVPPGLRVVDCVGAPAARPWRPDGVGLPPGVHRIVADGRPAVRLELVTAPRAEAAASPVTVAFPPFPAGLPGGTTWIPDDAGTAGVATQRAYVTCEQYAEWLDELPAEKRGARVPPQGFGRIDPSDSTRILAIAAFAERPVRGVRARHAAEYAAWRGLVYGVPVRLPTEAEWVRMARPGPCTEFATPEAAAAADGPWAVGVTNLSTGIGEIVRREGHADGPFAVKGATEDGGWLPLPSALERTRPLAPDAAHDAAFRLVVPVVDGG